MSRLRAYRRVAVAMVVTAGVAVSAAVFLHAGGAAVSAQSLDVRIVDSMMAEYFSASEWEHRGAWSPDGKMLAFVHKNDSGRLGWTVVSVDAVLRGEVNDGIDLEIGQSHTGGVCWNPDGKRLVFDICGADSRWRLLELSLTNGLTKLLDSPLDAGHPEYSPDGKSLAYVSVEERAGDKENRYRIHIRNLVTGTDRVLEEQGEYDTFRPRWSPDGKMIAYERSADEHSEIRIVNTVTRVNRAALEIAGGKCGDAQADATWSPSGRYLAFAAYSDGGDSNDCDRIVVVEPRTGRWTDLSKQEGGPGLMGELVWHPKKDWLLAREVDGISLFVLRTPRWLDRVPFLGPYCRLREVSPLSSAHGIKN